ncbi:hypothetical protein AWQ21_08235 [Picosynechococcus sp. PCC 7003]|uniref:hypothetical protein n=1 Tax=Picosynechococcus sp. PCC 7003 TaxID=374981 RepID=UPI000810C8B4|nr:hypothetical protein [Picosynechococcus sp. PCC 7003]ANV84371.1 hypothetical protein AWQ21_08235 [Picosynechococcus sp. PCC 7003]
MSILEDLPLNELEVGELVQVPCDFIKSKNKEKFNKIILENLVEQLKHSQRNILPVMIKQLEEDQYEAMHNTFILEDV